jgi:uncharacterized protein
MSIPAGAVDADQLIGRGWAYPAAIDPAGGVRLVSGSAEIEGALRMILSTAPGERVMRPDFGCAIWEQVFAPVNANTLGLVEHHVREAIVHWEPRIVLDSVRAVAAGTDHSMIEIRIEYQIRATNDHRNLVYPFYVIPHEEPAL